MSTALPFHPASSSRAPRRPAFDVTLTATQGAAFQRYAGAMETVATATKPGKRLGAADDLKHANAVLTPQQRAILDLVTKGKDLADLSIQTGRPTAALCDLLTGACDRLAAHYEAMVD